MNFVIAVFGLWIKQQTLNVPIGLIDNSVFYCKLKEYLNVTLNAVLVISHCLHFLNVLRKTISYEIIGNYVSAGLGLFSRFYTNTFLQG